mgnify:CR=1 FL=1
MTKYKKLLLPIVIVLVCAVIVWYVTSNPPKAKRSSPKNAAQIVVEVAQVKQQAYQVILTSFGTVQARTQSMLVAQVGGQIIKVSEQFRDGGFFEKGEALINENLVDLVAFGRPFIANPDFPERYKNDWAMADFDPDTLFGGDENGYTTYSKYSE